MPRYFFDLDARFPVEDELGALYASLEEAVSAAEFQLQKLLRYKHEVYAILVLDKERRLLKSVSRKADVGR